MEHEVIQSNPVPMPSVWKIGFISVVIIAYVLGALSLIRTVGCLSNGGFTVETIRECMTPSMITLLVGLVIVGGMYYYIPIGKELIVWVISLFNPPGGDEDGGEGFLVSPSTDPKAMDFVTTRRELLDRLREHLTNHATLPQGLQCSPGWNQGGGGGAPCSGRGPSKNAIFGYVQRIIQQSPEIKSISELPKGWEDAVHQLMSLVCEERCLLEGVISKIEVDSQIQYSFEDVKLRLTPLLRFYNRARILGGRYRSRREVNQLIGLPLGEKDPMTEVSIAGVPGKIHTQSIHNSGNDPAKPTPEMDIRGFLKALSTPHFSKESPILPTQTNELAVLEAIPQYSIPRGTVKGWNAPDVGYQHRRSSAYM